MFNNPVSYSDPDGDFPICVAIVAAAVVNGLINVGSQALSGNVHNLGQGLEYFAVGALAGTAYVTGQPILAGSIQVLIKDAKGAETFAASAGQAGFNMANTLGAYLGGIPIILGFSYDTPVLVGVGMTIVGIVLTIVFWRGKRA